MAIFGYLVLVIITFYVTVCSWFGTWASLAFTGRLCFGVIVWWIVAICCWYGLYINWPFEVALK